MGGGSSKAPDPKTFTPAPIQQAPVSAPIANYFQQGAKEQAKQAGHGMSPYDILAALQNASAIANGDQQPNPFANIKGLQIPGAPRQGGIIDLLNRGRG